MSARTLRFFFLLLFSAVNLGLWCKAYHYYGNVLRGSDGQMYYAFVRSLVLDHDLDFANELHSLTPFPQHIHGISFTKTGRIANKFPIGFAILAMPFFALGHVITITGNAIKLWSLPPDGYSPLYGLMVGLGQLVYALLGFAIGGAFLRRFYRERHVWAALTVVWFGTGLFYYATIDPIMSHACGFFCVSCIFYLTELPGREQRLSQYCLLGVVSGLAVVVRPTNAIFLLYPLVVFMGQLRRRSATPTWQATHVLGLALGAVSGAAVLGIQMFVWKAIYGEYVVFSYGGERFDWLKPQVGNVLFSSNHGLFFWFPLTLLAVAGLLMGSWGKHRLLPLISLAMFVLMLYLNAAWHSWWFGYGFGARSFSELGVPFAIGVMDCWKRFSRLLPAVAASGVAVSWTWYLLALQTLSYVPMGGTLSRKMLFPFIR